MKLFIEVGGQSVERMFTGRRRKVREIYTKRYNWKLFLASIFFEGGENEEREKGGREEKERKGDKCEVQELHHFASGVAKEESDALHRRDKRSPFTWKVRCGPAFSALPETWKEKRLRN